MEGTTEQVKEAGTPKPRKGKAQSEPKVEANGKDDVLAGEATIVSRVKQQPLSSGVSLTPVQVKINPRDKVEINIRTLLEAGVHFGHQTSRRNPKMNAYIHSSRNGIHIISLPKTAQAWTVAREAIVKTVADGGNVLFVGTKKQAQNIVREEAARCGAFFVAHRWLGGMITNFQTIRRSIERMTKIEAILKEEEEILAAGGTPKFKKKERLMMSREWEKLDVALGGIKDMYAVPQMLFVIDIKREDISIKEAHRLDIPVVALVDTNCDPNDVAYPVPSNDDGTRAIRLFCAAVADAVSEGKGVYKARGGDLQKKIRPSKAKPSKEEPKEEKIQAEPSAEEAKALAAEFNLPTEEEF